MSTVVSAETLWSTHCARQAVVWVFLSAISNATCTLLTRQSFGDTWTSVASLATLMGLLSSLFLACGASIALAFLTSRVRALTNYASFLLLSDVTARWAEKLCGNGSAGWSRATAVDLYRLTLSIWVAFPTFPAIINTFQMTRSIDAIRSSSWEHELKHVPTLQSIRPYIVWSTSHVSSMAHHYAQMGYEILLLQLAVVTGRHGDLWPVGTAAFGALFTVFSYGTGKSAEQVLRLGIFLETLATMSSILLLVAEFGRLSCYPLTSDTLLTLFLDIAMFAVLANVFRVNSVVHAFQQLRCQSWSSIYFHVNGEWPEASSLEHLQPRAMSSRAMNDSKAFDTKFVLLGNSGVGKTSVATRFVQGMFADDQPSTIGASFLTKRIVVNDWKLKLQIWDTAGQERFRSMTPMYYRGANAAMVMYDVTNDDSFAGAKSWVTELRTNVPSADIVLAVVGNKCDMDEKRTVTAESGRTYSASIGAMFFEVSAKKDEGIEAMFTEISKELVERKKRQEVAAAAAPKAQGVDLAKQGRAGNQRSQSCCSK
eukprot:m51a1_g5691 putative ras-related protein rab-5b (540) ;mRNA; r:1000610-1003295